MRRTWYLKSIPSHQGAAELAGPSRLECSTRDGRFELVVTSPSCLLSTSAFCSWVCTAQQDFLLMVKIGPLLRHLIHHSLTAGFCQISNPASAVPVHSGGIWALWCCWSASFPDSMAGGEREGHKKRQEPRFADKKPPKRPREKTALELRAERLQVPPSFVTTEDMVFCPFHGRELEGDELKCPTCRRGYVDRRVVYTPGNMIAVDYTQFIAHWRRVLFRRLKPPFHSHVRYLSEPHVDIQVIWKACAQDKNGLSYSMPSGSETNIKELETTWAVEEFCQFDVFEEGYRSCKLTGSGDVLMVVPPVEIAHVKSRVTGEKCRIEFGWCQLTATASFNKAENMPAPAEGWEHVEARARDAAAGMLRCGYPIAAAFVARSEAILRSKYATDEAFQKAREAREEARRNVLPKQVSQAERDARAKEKADKAVQVEMFYNGGKPVEYKGNPYEAYKHRPRPSKFTMISAIPSWWFA